MDGEQQVSFPYVRDDGDSLLLVEFLDGLGLLLPEGHEGLPVPLWTRVGLELGREERHL